MFVAVQPAKIRIRDLQALSAKQRKELLSAESQEFLELWSNHDRLFEEAINARDIDAADRIWSKVSERLLWNRPYPNESFPAHFPPRGTVLPREEVPICSKYCHITQMARYTFSCGGGGDSIA